jgi:hypothetical protein
MSRQRFKTRRVLLLSGMEILTSKAISLIDGYNTIDSIKAKIQEKEVCCYYLLVFSYQNLLEAATAHKNSFI